MKDEIINKDLSKRFKKKEQVRYCMIKKKTFLRQTCEFNVFMKLLWCYLLHMKLMLKLYNLLLINIIMEE